MAIIFKTNSVNPQRFLTLRCLLGLFSKVFIISKGRIHEFTWGHQPIIWAIFSENCMKIGPIYYVDPPLQLDLLMTVVNTFV